MEKRTPWTGEQIVEALRQLDVNETLTVETTADQLLGSVLSVFLAGRADQYTYNNPFKNHITYKTEPLTQEDGTEIGSHVRTYIVTFARVLMQPGE